MKGVEAMDEVICVACGESLVPDDRGDYLYCDYCDDGPFCAQHWAEHVDACMDEGSDEWD